MQRYYSKTTGNTYLAALHGDNMPADAQLIDEARYLSVIANPAPGKIRSHDADGLPILIDPPVYEPTPDDHRAVVAARRYQAETAGITVDSMTIDTGRDSQALITGAALAAMLDPAYTCSWKTQAGFIELTAEQIIALAQAVRAHVQACFDREADLLEALASGTFTDAMLEEGWPNESLPESTTG